MKSLEIILREHGFDTSFYKEDIKDNEYILISTLKDKKSKAQKNLEYLFFGFMEKDAKPISDSINEFLEILESYK